MLGQKDIVYNTSFKLAINFVELSNNSMAVHHFVLDVKQVC